MRQLRYEEVATGNSELAVLARKSSAATMPGEARGLLATYTRYDKASVTLSCTAV